MVFDKKDVNKKIENDKGVSYYLNNLKSKKMNLTIHQMVYLGIYLMIVLNILIISQFQIQKRLIFLRYCTMLSSM